MTRPNAERRKELERLVEKDIARGGDMPPVPTSHELRALLADSEALERVEAMLSAWKEHEPKDAVADLEYNLGRD